MAKKFSTLLLITLILALPLRAVAGVAMSGCAMSHHGLSGQMMQDVATADACLAKHGESAACHEDGSMPSKHVGSTCSVCGDCCVGALSIPVGTDARFGSEPPSLPIAFTDLAYAGFQPDGPDRPPRHSVL